MEEGMEYRRNPFGLVLAMCKSELWVISGRYIREYRLDEAVLHGYQRIYVL